MSDFARTNVNVLECDLDTCSLTYGVSPCTAAAGVGNECRNTFKTCQDKPNYARATKTYKFVTLGAPLQGSDPMRPYIKSVALSPTEIDPEAGVARRADVKLVLVDDVCSDIGLDPYVTTRAQAAQGTYWTRLLARVHNYSGRWARLKRAYFTAGWDDGQFVTENYIIDSIKGPVRGEVTIILKDPIKLADRQKVPFPTSGKLAVALGTNDLQIILNAGDGLEYESAGYVRVGDQVIRYTHKHVAQGWNFSDGALEGWTTSNASATGSTDAVTLTATAGDPNFRVVGIAIAGGANRYVRARIRQLVAGTWQGTLFYRTDLHGESGSYYKQIAEPVDLATGAWVIVTFDMHNLTVGGVDWSQETITGLRLDIVSGAVGSFEIDWIGYAANDSFDADVLYLPDSTYRSQFKTTAVAAKVGDGVQQCKVFVDQPVSSVIEQLLNAAGIDDSYIDIAGMQSEDNAWLGSRYNITACIPEPEDITALLGELCQQTNAMLWWSPTEQKVKYKVLAPSAPNVVIGATLTDDANFIMDSVKVDTLDAHRLTFFGVYYDLATATANRKENKNYLRGELYIDVDAESDNEYGDRRQKIFQSRWFGADNDVAMATLAARKISHYRDAPKKIEFKLDPKDAAIVEGDLYDITTDQITDESGAAKTVRALIVKRKDNQGDVEVTALTTTFDRRYGFIAPAGYPNYASASAAQRAYAYISNSAGLMSDGSKGYLVI